MLDDSDLDFAVLASPWGGCFGTIVSLVIVGVVWYFVAQNENECAEKHCDRGKSVLMHHECLCVEEAK